MGIYLMYGKYNPGSVNKISAERTDKAKDLIEKNGGNVKAGYALLGGRDLLFIVNFPKLSGVMKASVELGNLLDITFSSYPAMTIDEFDQIF